MFLLNAAPARSDVDDLLRFVDVLVVNETELGILAGRQFGAGDEADAASQLMRRGPRGVIVTLGARGALLVQPARSAVVEAFPVHGLDSLAEAARYASAAGALTCTRPGAQPSLPTSSEVDHFLASQTLPA